jgi:hypothetical protein
MPVSICWRRQTGLEMVKAHLSSGKKLSSVWMFATDRHEKVGWFGESPGDMPRRNMSVRPGPADGKAFQLSRT